jgi:hypothetical protein
MGKQSRRPGRRTRHQRPPDLGKRVCISIEVEDRGDQWSVSGGWDIEAADGHSGMFGDLATPSATIDVGAIRAAVRWLSERVAECEASAREPR